MKKTWSLPEAARVFAVAAHGAIGQQRKYEGTAYVEHPCRVAMLVRAAGGSDEEIAAAYLHDVLEDTQVTQRDIEREFGLRVFGLVWELTDHHPKKVYHTWNRQMRKDAERERLSRVSAAAQTIKLADLIDNTSSIVEGDPDFARVYVREKRELLKVLTRGHDMLAREADMQLRAAEKALGIV